MREGSTRINVRDDRAIWLLVKPLHSFALETPKSITTFPIAERPGAALMSMP